MSLKNKLTGLTARESLEQMENELQMDFEVADGETENSLANIDFGEVDGLMREIEVIGTLNEENQRLHDENHLLNIENEGLHRQLIESLTPKFEKQEYIGKFPEIREDDTELLERHMDRVLTDYCNFVRKTKDEVRNDFSMCEYTSLRSFAIIDIISLRTLGTILERGSYKVEIEK